MSVRTKILTAAERLFDTRGFHATGMDRLTETSEVSSRTLYKHVGGKAELIAAVLTRRHERFFERLCVRSVADLFIGLEQWMIEEGARGCLFLRAAGEHGEDSPAISEAIRSHKAHLQDKISQLVMQEIGDRPDIAEQVLVLVEGAVAAAVYRGPGVAVAAGRAAGTLMRQANHK